MTETQPLDHLFEIVEAALHKERLLPNVFLSMDRANYKIIIELSQGVKAETPFGVDENFLKVEPLPMKLDFDAEDDEPGAEETTALTKHKNWNQRSWHINDIMNGITDENLDEILDPNYILTADGVEEAEEFSPHQKTACKSGSGDSSSQSKLDQLICQYCGFGVENKLDLPLHLLLEHGVKDGKCVLSQEELGDEPAQPVLGLDEYPVRRGKRFQVQWFTLHPWLGYSVEKDIAYCFPCNKWGNENAFQFKYWSKSNKLRQHSRTKIHLKTTEMWNKYRRSKGILIKQDVEEDTEEDITVDAALKEEDEFVALKLDFLGDSPMQPKLKKYPKSFKNNSENRTCQFQPSWYLKHPWINYSVKLNQVTCFPCVKYKSGRSFILTQWRKYSRLKKHEFSKLHKLSMFKWIQHRKENDIRDQLDKHLNIDAITSAVLEAEAKVTKTSRVSCRKCNMTFDDKPAFARHARLMHSKIIVCPICGIQLNDYNFGKHKRTMHLGKKNVPVKCDICQKTLSSAYALRTHKSYVHDKSNINACELCNRGFQTPAHLRRHHTMVHEKKRDFGCETCGFRFAERRKLIDHHRTVHDKLKLFVCKICGKEYAHDYALQSHLRTHAGIRPYKCTFCPCDFTDNRTLKNHALKAHNRVIAGGISNECLNKVKEILAEKGQLQIADK